MSGRRYTNTPRDQLIREIERSHLEIERLKEKLEIATSVKPGDVYELNLLADGMRLSNCHLEVHGATPTHIWGRIFESSEEFNLELTYSGNVKDGG